jgi:hypothetical protein
MEHGCSQPVHGRKYRPPGVTYGVRLVGAEAPWFGLCWEGVPLLLVGGVR